MMKTIDPMIRTNSLVWLLPHKPAVRCWTRWLLLAIVLCGCSSELQKYSISGKASFEGKPIDKGEITFSPVGGAGRPDSAVFSNGEYQVSVTAGKKVVRISAWSTDPALVGPPPPDMPKDGINPDREYIPDRYNENSTLEIEVLSENGQTFDFPLTKKPK
jgi:hypothetical protein